MSETKVIVSKRAWKLVRTVGRIIEDTARRTAEALAAYEGKEDSGEDWWPLAGFAGHAPESWRWIYVRRQDETPWGRWQSDLYIIVDEFDDDRDLPLPDGEHALTWRAPHQWPAQGLKIGTVYQSGEEKTLLLRPKVWKAAGLSKEAIADYAQWATGNY